MSLKVPAEIIDVNALLSDEDEKADAIQFVGYGLGKNSRYTNAPGAGRVMTVKNEPIAPRPACLRPQDPICNSKSKFAIMTPRETSALIRHSLIISPVCSSHTLFTYAFPGLFKVVEEVRF
jgi:hypothetical protein